MNGNVWMRRSDWIIWTTEIGYHPKPIYPTGAIIEPGWEDYTTNTFKGRIRDLCVVHDISLLVSVQMRTGLSQLVEAFRIALRNYA